MTINNDIIINETDQYCEAIIDYWLKWRGKPEDQTNDIIIILFYY